MKEENPGSPEQGAPASAAPPANPAASKAVSLADWIQPQKEELVRVGEGVRQNDMGMYDHLGWEILFSPVEKKLLKAYSVNRVLPQDWKGLVLYTLILELRLAEDLSTLQGSGGKAARLPARLQSIYSALVSQTKNCADKSIEKAKKKKRVTKVETLGHTLARLEVLGRVVAGEPPPPRGQALAPDAVAQAEREKKKSRPPGAFAQRRGRG